jgi:flagellar basal body-associated protein FliL
VDWATKMNNKILIISIIITVIVALAVLTISILLSNKPPTLFTIASVSPEPYSQNINLSPQIHITFSRQLTKNEEKTVSINISPSVKNSLIWENTDNSFALSLGENLLPQTDYLVTVNYPANSYSWRFRTQGPTQEPTQETQPPQTEQGQADLRFSQGQQDFLKSHPWYNNLPPENDNYYINYDVGANDFYVDLYPTSNSSTPINTQIEQFKNEVINVLKSLGIDTSTYKIEWIIAPK